MDLLSRESSFEELDVESVYDSSAAGGQYHTRSCSRSLLKWWPSSTTICPIKGGRHSIANWMIASLPAVRLSHQKGNFLSFLSFTMKSQGHGNPHILPVSTIPQCFIHLSWDWMYKSIPQVEETLISYCSPASAFLSMKRPALPSRPCCVTSALVGKACHCGVTGLPVWPA